MKSPSNRQTHKNTDTPLPSPVLLNQYKESRKNTKKITITHSYNRIIATKQKKTATLQNRTLIERPPERSLLGGSLD